MIISDRIEIDDRDSESLATLYKVFGDSTRIKILSAILEGELSVGEISEKLGMSQSAISHQLNGLRQSKLVKSKRNGKSILYSLDDEHVKAIICCGLEHIRES